MPSVEHTAVVNAPIENVWQYLEKMSNWAPFLKGYQKHEEINDKESIWTLKGDVGVLSRIVEIKITITEWIEMQKISFELEGITEKVTGNGTFVPSAKSSDSTELFFVLMKPMLKPVAMDMGDGIKKDIETGRA